MEFGIVALAMEIPRKQKWQRKKRIQDPVSGIRSTAFTKKCPEGRAGKKSSYESKFLMVTTKLVSSKSHSAEVGSCIMK